jgi:hypothetical protein
MPAPTSEASFSLVTAKTAQEVCALFKPDVKAQELLLPDHKPRQFYEILLTKELEVEAARFLAQALPKREAVWWACTSVRQASGAQILPKASAALAAAEKWVAEPTEPNRQAAQPTAEAAGGMDTPAGCAAMAAFWSGGSMAPPGKQVVAPAENLTASAVAGALIQAALLNAPEKFAANLRGFLSVGVAVASGTNRWKESAPSPGSGSRR